MCGIVAIFKLPGDDCPAEVVSRMRDEVTHRGPDDQGSAYFARSGSTWAPVEPSVPRWEVGLGHRRLSILDLSPAGHQPMVYQEKFWITYNGEVYNFLELRTELERLGHRFRSESDTEVILAAYAEWGPACFSRFRGMWSLVIFDSSRNEAILCRDRLGIKPLYLWQTPGLIAVASEIKQFRHVPGFVPRLNPGAASLYLQTGYEGSEESFFSGVRPLQPGTWLRISLDKLNLSTSAESYWHPERVQVSVTDPEEAGRLFAEKLRECVRIHLRSDVPVGCALSGGLDSSSIAVIVDSLKNGNGGSLHTFTSTFPGDRTDEREYADAIVDEIDATPHRVTPAPETFLEDFDRFIWVHDEPVGSLSMYAGYCIARLTRSAGVPVTLNGQGGDEILSGYWQSYFLHLRELLRSGRVWGCGAHFIGALLPRGNRSLVQQLPVMLRRYRARRQPPLEVNLARTFPKGPGLLSEILSLDSQARRVFEIRTMFLPRLLKWDDRNFMAFSVEGRYPFLDHELIELCLSFSPETLYRQGWTKRPLRLGLRSVIPQKVLHRRSKFGFETPQDRWLCGPLRHALEGWVKGEGPIWNLIDRNAVEKLSEQTWRGNGSQEELGQALFRLFVFDRWLRVCKIQTTS